MIALAACSLGAFATSCRTTRADDGRETTGVEPWRPSAPEDRAASEPDASSIALPQPRAAAQTGEDGAPVAAQDTTSTPVATDPAAPISGDANATGRDSSESGETTPREASSDAAAGADADRPRANDGPPPSNGAPIAIDPTTPRPLAGHVAFEPLAADSIHDPEVRALVVRYYEDFATGDWTRVAQHFWPNASIVTIRSPAPGAPAAVVALRIEDYVQRHGAGGGRVQPLEIKLLKTRFDIDGSIASLMQPYRASDPSGDEKQSWNGGDLFAFVKHEGKWRIASLVFEGARLFR